MSADDVRSGTGASAELFFEDLTPGRTFDLGVITVDAAEMVAFARRFDPQWYHVDEELARQSHHGGLIASGFYTVSLFMRAYVDHVLSRAAADASPGLEELRWLAPVRAGDHLAVRLDVIGSKPSTARPGLGTVTLIGTMLRLDADGRPECEVLRTRFRGWFTLRTVHPDVDEPELLDARPDDRPTGPGDPPAERERDRPGEPERDRPGEPGDRPAEPEREPGHGQHPHEPDQRDGQSALRNRSDGDQGPGAAAPDRIPAPRPTSALDGPTAFLQSPVAPPPPPPPTPRSLDAPTAVIPATRPDAPRPPVPHHPVDHEVDGDVDLPERR